MPPTGQHVIGPLDPAVHRREEFSCESSDLTDFLKTRARKEMQARASACFVLVPETDRGRIAGYYTLSAATVELSRLPADLIKKLPRYPQMPATLLGRLARDIGYKGQGIGDLLLADALARVVANSVVIGSVAVVTDPKDERAAKFYGEFGFKPLDERRMFLPMKDVQEWLQVKSAGGT